jgi:hypothetical protein
MLQCVSQVTQALLPSPWGRASLLTTYRGHLNNCFFNSMQIALLVLCCRL